MPLVRKFSTKLFTTEEKREAIELWKPKIPPRNIKTEITMDNSEYLKSGSRACQGG
jgi:hypothetical protein